MTESRPYFELDDRTRRALMRRALFRPSVTALTLIALYFMVPLDEVRNLGTVVFLVVVLVGVLIVGVWQVRRIVRADYPAVQAAEAMAAVVPIYLIGFSVAYYLIAAASDGNFNEPVSKMGALYFTLSVFATVGFGDITAQTDFARAVVSVQMAGNLVFLAVGGRLLVAAVKRGQARRSSK